MGETRRSVYHPKFAKKAFRANAREAGMRYVDALQARKEAQVEAGAKTLHTKPGIGRRNPGRMDGVKWNGDSFVCATHVDGDDHDSDSERYSDSGYDSESDVQDERRPDSKTYEISLMDIAKPMKVKGVAKEFEIVQTVQRVIALEDDAKSDAWDLASCAESDWDEVYDEDLLEAPEKARQTYSDASRAKPKGVGTGT
ncbi:hypothetical protein PM082_009596 [Marasmius tenuissimus]|nr:hypothetical protein PM082_009596 [Marasmius tenuissimus]